MAKSPKKPKNLLLEPDAIARGERYGSRHGKKLSRLVDDFLRALPLDESDSTLAPLVRRLHGVAALAATDRPAYREHLYRKYVKR